MDLFNSEIQEIKSRIEQERRVSTGNMKFSIETKCAVSNIAKHFDSQADLARRLTITGATLGRWKKEFANHPPLPRKLKVELESQEMKVEQKGSDSFFQAILPNGICLNGLRFEQKVLLMLMGGV